MIKSLAKRMIERGIKPELEAFDMGMINYAKYLIHKGSLDLRCYINLLFRNIACAQAKLKTVGLMIDKLSENSIYSLAGIGRFLQKICALAVVAASGVRIGLEDNI